MNQNKSSTIKKEIFLPSIIGDWTTYTSEKNQKSISITKSIGISNKTVSEQNINHILFFHQEFFEIFFEKIAQEINSHIEIESISINVTNHYLFKQSLKSDIYQSKFKLPELEQIDLILSKKATKFIAHRLCGGTTAPSENDLDPTDVEISLVSVINSLFIDHLSNKWNKIFLVTNNNSNTSFGHYHFDPQQSENETIIELSANFKLFNQHNLFCKIVYSLETIEKLLFYEDLLNQNIVDNTFLNKNTLKKTNVDVKSVIGTTTLALNEIQNLEIGDVILLEKQPLTAPIEVIIGDEVVFHGHPININNRNVGVQIHSTPNYENYVKEPSKPTEGPFLSSENVSEISPIQSPSNPEPEIETVEESDIDSVSEETFNTQEEESQDETLPNDISPIDEPNVAVTTSNDNVANDDFSWDDLEDE